MTASEHSAEPPRRKAPLRRRVLLGTPMIALGGFVAVFMSISVFLEIRTDDFFGMCVAALVAFSGAILAYEDYRTLTGTRRPSILTTPSSFHRKAYAPAMGYPKGMPPDAARCAEAFYDGWQCPGSRGYGPESAFCLKHANQRERAAA